MSRFPSAFIIFRTVRVRVSSLLNKDSIDAFFSVRNKENEMDLAVLGRTIRWSEWGRKRH